MMNRVIRIVVLILVNVLPVALRAANLQAANKRSEGEQMVLLTPHTEAPSFGSVSEMRPVSDVYAFGTVNRVFDQDEQTTDQKNVQAQHHHRRSSSFDVGALQPLGEPRARRNSLPGAGNEQHPLRPLRNPVRNPFGHVEHSLGFGATQERYEPVDVTAPELTQRSCLVTVAKPAIYYGVLLALGLCHGLVNNYLSNGEPNKHFYAAPWVEWEVGAVANVLELVVAFGGMRLFKVLEPMSRSQQNWFGRPLALVLLSAAQMAGESMPLARRSAREGAVNMWVIPLAVWYAWQAGRRLCMPRALTISGY